MPTPERIEQVCRLLGVAPGDDQYTVVHDAAKNGGPPFRIAQHLKVSEEKWRRLVGK